MAQINNSGYKLAIFIILDVLYAKYNQYFSRKT